MYQRLSTMGSSVKLKAGCFGFNSRSFSGRSSRVTSLPPSSSAAESLEKSWTELRQEDLTTLQAVIKTTFDEKSKQTETPNESLFSDAVKGNIGMCSEIFEKCGNVSNQNITQVKSFPRASAELRHVFASVLQGVGNLHWMGVGLVLLAFCIDRWSKEQSNKADCWDVLEKLSSLATQTLDLMDSLPEEKIVRVIDLINKYVSECLQQLRASRPKRILYAPSQEGRLKRLDREINYVFDDLTLSVTIRCLSPMSTTTFNDDHDGMVGLPQRVDDIVSRLEEEGSFARSEVRSIVLCGMLGVGTSTLGEAVIARLAKRRFEGRTSCRILMKQWSRLRDFKFPEMQAQIIENLSKEKRKFADHMDGQKGLTACFKKLKKPVQIFIDNVANEEQLRHLLPDNMGRDLPNGSRLLVATFNERVCDFIRRDIKGFESCKLYEVRELESKEARELFCRKAFGKPEVPEEFNDSKLRKKMDEVLKICGGLPLALEHVGKYVGNPKRGTDMKKSEVILSRLSHAVKTLPMGDPLGGTKIDRLATMKFAYDQLGSPLQSDFLDISAIYVGRSWKEAELQFGENLQTLKEFSLLRKENHVHGNGNQAVVAMHGLLVALGQKQGHVYHEGVRVVAKNEDTVAYCPRDAAGLRRVQLLHLDHCTVNPVKCFQETGKLRHLELYGMEFKKKCLLFPPKNLQSIHFRCPKSRLPFSIETLSLMDELLVLKLWSNPLVDEDFRTFKTPARLKMLKLTDSKTLEEIQKGRNSSLEQLILWGCPQLRKIGQLSPTINKLFILGSPRIEDLSGIGDLHALEELSLINCELKPDNFGLPLNLRSLDLRGCPQVENLSGIGDLRDLEELCLINCGLKTDNFRIPPNLHSLDLSNNPNLVRLPHFSHCKLKKITLRNCSSLVQVPDSLLPLLRRSDILGCSRLKDLPNRLMLSPESTSQSPPSAGHTCTWVRTRVRDHVFPLHKFRKSISDKMIWSKEENDARERERRASNGFSSRSEREHGTSSSSLSTESSFTSRLSSALPSRASLYASPSLLPQHLDPADLKINSFISSGLSAADRPTVA